MQVFVTWKTSLDEIDEFKLRELVEDFGLVSAPDGTNRFPRDVFLVLAGVDTQDDRFEVALWGFNETEAYFLSHDVVWGDPADSVTQAELDTLLKTTWLHPNGWRIGIEGAAMDSAGHKTQAVYDFCGLASRKKYIRLSPKRGRENFGHHPNRSGTTCVLLSSATMRQKRLFCKG
jgi:phage terminase large subunit GpA-like protein